MVKKTTLSSFTKSIEVAKGFATNNIVLEIEGNQTLPGIDFTTGQFQSEYGEREVLLPPGTFTVLERFPDHYNNVWIILVKFEPYIKNTSYLHRMPQVHVRTPSPPKPKYYTGKRGGVYTLAPNGKKKYVSLKLKKTITKK